MTCDGKVLALTQREVGGIALANGGDPQDEFDDMLRWSTYVFWLAATAETAYRLCNGVDDGPDRPDLALWRQERRDQWYA